VVVVVRRPGVVPSVQAVLGRLVEAHAVQPKEREIRPETDHGHGVVGRLAFVVGDSELRLGHVVALEVRVPVRLALVHEHVAADARDQQIGGIVVLKFFGRELGSGARQFETAPFVHVQPALRVRIDDRVLFTVARERYGHFRLVFFSHP